MPYSQKDLVWLHDSIPLPDGTDLPHPVLIISCNSANSYENHYTGVMMTSSEHRDKFSFNLDSSMFEGPIKANSQIRLYLIIGFNEIQIKKLANRMKKPHFQALMQQLQNYIFPCD